MPYKVFAPFERLLAEDLNTYYSEQVPAIFTTAAARDLAIPAPVLGQPAFLTTPRALTRWNGTAWKTEAIAGGAAATLGAGSSQSIPNTTLTKILLPTVVEDLGGFALGNNELTIPVGYAGLYQVIGAIFWASQSTVVGFRDCQVRVNAGNAVARAIQSQGTASIAAIQSVAGLARLADGDLVSLWGAQTHGAAINSANDQLYAPRLAIVRIGD